MNVTADNDQGKFFSWRIVNDHVAIKHCDISVFKYRETGIPAETKWFWDIEGQRYPYKRDITVIYSGNEYQACVEITSNNRTHFRWYSDLSKHLNQIWKAGEAFPMLRVEKITADKYLLVFLDLDRIASDADNSLENTIPASPAGSTEGGKTQYYVTKYERSPKNRKDAILIHGTTCMACGFDFEAVYGEIGQNFIEVHHLKPLSSLEEEVSINPQADLACLCSNCHRMVHRKRDHILSLEELNALIRNSRMNN